MLTPKRTQVWTTLYALMGYSAYRAWNTGMSSLNPSTIELTKVLIRVAFFSFGTFLAMQR